jgi:acyl carrier protein
MNDPEIYAALDDIFREVLEDPSITLSPEATADTIEGWDSMNHIFIVLEIEKRFGVKFQTAEMEELKDVGELVAVLKQKLPPSV